jgi:F-type H+-transporting ATPase subunit gamma
MPIGRKAVDYFSRRKWKIRDTVINWGGKITYSEVAAFTQKVLDAYFKQELDEVWIIYTHYINLLERKIVLQKLLRIDPPVKEKPINYIFEPNTADVLNAILPKYCIAIIQRALNEAYASELAARIFSMRTAAKNAEELIEKLTLVRNKLRQSGITRELIEITSCGESLK